MFKTSLLVRLAPRPTAGLERLRLERLTALDGLPSEWGEYEPYPLPYKRGRVGAGLHTKAVSGYSLCRGAGGKYGSY